MSKQIEYDLIVCGAGAAGVFAAIRLSEQHPDARILILEKSSRMLEKVKVSGGGRCNITNAETNPEAFAAAYPRGKHFMRKALGVFGPTDMLNWFNKHNLNHHIEQDGRIFPASNSSSSVIRCFTDLLEKNNIDVLFRSPLTEINYVNGKILITSAGDSFLTKSLLIAAGGNAIEAFEKLLSPFNVAFEPPVPSLFTFNVRDKSFTDLMGLSSIARVSIPGTAFRETGPLLITHWGFSGPPVLRCSAFAARYLADINYHFRISISWLPHTAQEDFKQFLLNSKKQDSRKLIKNSIAPELPARLREALLQRASCDLNLNWADVSLKTINRLVETFTADIWEVQGKTTFKEEFVTCGGIRLSEIHPSSMMLKKCPGIFAAGEIIDVDGITGGYNFQNAWTSADISAKGIMNYLCQTEQ